MNEKQLDAILKLTASRLGTTPEALKEAANNGDMAKIIGNQKDAELFSKVLSDPEAAKKMLATPQAQQLLKMLGQQNN